MKAEIHAIMVGIFLLSFLAGWRQPVPTTAGPAMAASGPRKS